MTNQSNTSRGQEMLPCPFCGSNPEPYTVCNGDGAELEFMYRCEECGIEKSAEWRHEAIAAWNRRSPFQIEIGETAMLQKTLQALKDLLAVVAEQPILRARKYVGLGIQVSDAIASAEAAISAAECHPMTGKSKATDGALDVRVKPLEWIERVGVTDTFDAKTSIGNYIAAVTDDGMAFWFLVGQTRSNYCDTLEAAKSAAQDDFEARIRSSLAAPPQVEPAEGEKKP